MPRDLPDWGAQSSQATVHEVTDLGELAVRLGSIDRFDRRGDVIFLDDFQDGLLKWTPGMSGVGAAVDLSFREVRNGILACRLLAGSDANTQALIYRELHFPVLSGMGLEVSFQIPPATDEIQFQFPLWDGVDFHDFEFIWSDTLNELQYRDESDNHVAFATGVDLSISSGLFHIAKLVIDAEKKEYSRVILDDTAYPLPGKTPSITASATLPRLRVRIENRGRSGNNDVVYLGDVIVTQNEPL